jgi:hypothetical protein
MKDSLVLIEIYKKYLAITSEMVTILERHFQELDSDNPEVKEKRTAFLKHAQGTITSFNDDLHKLFRLTWELKDVEDGK